MGVVDWDRTYSDLEGLQKAGLSIGVLENIIQIAKFEIPKLKRWMFADLARRAGDPLLSLKILIHSQPSRLAIETDREKIAYALGLVSLGNIKEARKWLGLVRQPEFVVESLYVDALANIRQWDYEAAYNNLISYNARANPQGYKYLVVQVNIVACLVALGRLEEAESFFPELRKSLVEQNANLLLANLDEVEAQWRFLRGHKIVPLGVETTNKRSLLFAAKWRILGRFANEPMTSLEADLKDLRVQAASIGHWETLRDLDFHELIQTHRQDLYDKLFWGTRFKSFRKKLSVLEMSPSPHLVLGPLTFDRLEVVNIWAELKPGSSMRMLLQTLLSDLYKPLSVGEVFEGAHPNEYFNPESSPERVRRALLRLRAWLATKPWGIDVAIARGSFSLTYSKPLTIPLPSTSDPKFDQIQKRFGTKWFTREEAERELHLPERSARRLLAGWMDDSLLESSGGASKSVRYRLLTDK